MNGFWLAGVVLVVSAAGCSSDGPDSGTPKTYDIDKAPPALLPYAERANAAFDVTKAKLGKALMEALGEGGPVHAIPFCKVEAPKLAAGSEQGFQIGRTSHRCRNPENVAREWLRPIVEAAAGKKITEVNGSVVDLGDRVGVATPIGTMKFCLACHGGDADVAPETVRVLKEHYPEDRAVGFAEGDVRGFFWAELEKNAR